MIPTWGQIYDQVRVLLNDTEVPGGQLFTNANLVEHAKDVTEGVFRAFRRYDVPYVDKETFVRVPPHTSYVDLAWAGINSAGTVTDLWVKTPEVLVDVPLSPAPSNDPTTGFVRLQPFSLDGLATGDLVEVILDRRFYGIVNDTWTITVDSPFIILNGCLAAIKDASLYVGAQPGYVAKGGQWRQLAGPVNDWDPADRGHQGTGATSQWALRGSAIRLWPASTDSQVLSVSYGVAGEMDMATPDAVAQLDDSLMLYANGIAGLAARSKGQPGSEIFFQTAYGPTLQPTGEGGILGGMINEMVKNQQMTPRKKARFAPRNWNKGFVREQWFRGFRY